MYKLIIGLLAVALTVQLSARPVLDTALQSQLLNHEIEELTVIVKFRNSGPAISNSKDLSPAQILKQKRLNASMSQKSLAEAIRSIRQKSSAIKRVETLWINNSMIITASRSFVQSLTERDDLERIDLDTELKVFEPILRSAEKGINTDEYTYGLKKIQAARVWNELGLDGSGVTVGVLDTGVDTEHETLAGRVLATRDFVTSYEDDTANDGHGHGTHCSGTIGGTNAGGRYIGVAPGVNFIVGKIFGDNGSTTAASILSGMQWITDPDNDPQTNDFPRVISNSWGGALTNRWQDIITTWYNMGIIPVFAAGNSGPTAGTIGAPGGYAEVISIGATDHEDEIAAFSSRGPVTYYGATYIKPDVAAPGVDVYSAKPGGGFQNMSGTSMATPHVAGVVALMLQADSTIDTETVRQILKDTSLDLGAPGMDPAFGAGRVDAYDAVQFVLTGGKALVTVGSGDQIATIKVMPGNKIYRTRSNGEALVSLAAGTYQFTISAFGYYSKILDVEITAKQTVELSANLEQAPGFNVSFETRNGDGVVQNSKIKFMGVPVEGGSTNGSSLEVNLPGGDYTVEVKTVAYQTTEVNFSVRANTHVFIALEELPEYLIVDHGKKGNSLASYYTDVLDALGKNYDVRTKIIPDGITGYQTIIWYTGHTSGAHRVASEWEQEMLTEFVQSGGRLIMTGQDIGYALKRASFYKEFIGANYVKDKSAIKVISDSNSSFQLDGEDSANNQKFPDVIAVDPNAQNVEVLYSYQGQGPAVLSKSHGAGKVVYMAFGFEGINGGQNRVDFMRGILDLVGASVSEQLDRIAWAYQEDQNAFQTLVQNFRITEENRKEVETYLQNKKQKEPFRKLIQALRTR